ncbi:hypothetical protein [Nostoc sp. 'Lobaria pulmonaria (5183) cyanobiont']|uniref:hypothetical protein n=1 Tax=Nostoc sp. 'Lobaria pulmonaria (5183) cyanobiont' TaxID=1618022 RepID=UPI000CF3548E|nr:hypothetical protein [Nostoc sp. 'Lobaria pulmonaria (5183) cyanobiont']AVH70025.1 hypothetical protein NLP_1227 [Nostoc sp. 'Lobaria pulmonaria (5183) cyanobiont']
MIQLNILEIAKQGDTNAINTLVSQWLNSPRITSKTSFKQNCLQIMLESIEIPAQQLVVPVICDGLINLGIQSFNNVKIYGRVTGEDFPDWQQEIELEALINSTVLTPQTNIEVESSIAITKTKTDNQLTVKKPSFLGSLLGTVAGTAGVVGGAAVLAGQAVAGAAVGIGGAIGGAAFQATQIVGQALAIVGNNPQLEVAIKSLNQDWLNPLIQQVDLVKAEAAVRKLQQEHPNEQPAQIAHHLMLEKAVLAGGTGLASSLIPGQATAMFMVDWAATSTLSVELVYQIAAAYGMNLNDSERRGEAVAIFGLGLGGKTAIKAGLGLLRNLPVAGAVIGASSNAVMIYALGYAACQFYEAKQNPLTLEATLVDAQLESGKFLEAAISQEKIMDQILVHIVLAGNPDKSWEDILPELQAVNLSPESIDAIAANIKSPPSLETLLEQINSDFAVPLLAQCQKIAHLDGVITPEEAKVLETINKKLNRDLAAIK